jgi:glycosyltransferase involved in cell wall biosynthesis
MAKLRVKHVHDTVDGKSGGPSGYLGLLSRALTLYDLPDDISLLVTRYVPLNTKGRSTSNRRSPLSRMANDLLVVEKNQNEFSASLGAFFASIRNYVDSISLADCERLFDCDLLFVHNVYGAGKLVELCPEEARNKLVLITHTPKYLIHEQACILYPDIDEDILYADPYVGRLVDYELSAMKSARMVVWPCVEAQEGYEEWYRQYHSDEVQSAFAETGVSTPNLTIDSAELRKRWGVDKSQRIALFMGRAHRHKGFDKFLDLADMFNKTGRKDWVFVFAGQKPETKRDLSSIRLVGFQPPDAYVAADIVLTFNRYSNFDIGLLQAMSLGANVVVSASGGHKHLIKVCPAIHTIPDTDLKACWKHLEEVASEYAESKERQKQFIQIANERFSLRCFVRNHVAVSKEIAAGFHGGIFE